MSTDLITLSCSQWFTSAPMCDGFLTLAKTPGDGAVDSAGSRKTPLSCFLVPRWTSSLVVDGEHFSSEPVRNSGFRVMRLKDKLADRANASSEVEYHNAIGQLVGAPGKGVKVLSLFIVNRFIRLTAGPRFVQVIMDMVQSTRLDCSLGSAAAARRALQLAMNHTVSCCWTSLFSCNCLEN